MAWIRPPCASSVSVQVRRRSRPSAAGTAIWTKLKRNAGGAVTAKLRQAQAFGHHPLPGEGRIAVDQDRQRHRPVRRAVQGCAMKRAALVAVLLLERVVLGVRAARR